MKIYIKFGALGALLIPVVVVAGVVLKTNSDNNDYVNKGKIEWKALMDETNANTDKVKSFNDFIIQDDEKNAPVTFILQRHALSPLTESLQYALLSSGDTYIDSVYDEFDYNALNDVKKGNTKIHISNSGKSSLEIPNGWVDIAKKAAKSGRKINVIVPIDRFAQDQIALERADEILKLATNILALEDGKSNLSGETNEDFSKAIKALSTGTVPPRNTLIGIGKWKKTGSYTGFGFVDSQGSDEYSQSYLAINYLPKVHAFFTGASSTKINGNKTYEDYGFGNIDQMQLQADIFNHSSNMSKEEPGKPRKFLALRSFFASATIKQIKSSIDHTKKQYLMLGTYTSGSPNLQAGDNFKETFAKFYQKMQVQGYQLFWKGHPNGDAEGEWISNEFLTHGYKLPDGTKVKPSANSLIVLPPEGAVESFYDLRDKITDTPVFSWDGIGVVQTGTPDDAKIKETQFTSSVNDPSLYANWERFKDVLFLGKKPNGEGAGIITDAYNHWKLLKDQKTNAVTGYDSKYTD